MESNFDQFISPEFNVLSPSKKYDFFLKIITESIRANTPRKRKVRRSACRNPVPWWDAECDKIKRLRKAAFKKWDFTGELIDLIAYNKRCAEAKRIFKNKKIAKFREFVSTLNFKSKSKYTWNKCKIFKNKWAKVSNNMESNAFSSLTQKALDELCVPGEPSNPSYIPPSAKPNEFLDKPFSLIEFNAALNSCKKSSSPGMDGITYQILAQLPFRYKLILLDILNEVYCTSDFPTAWLNTFIHFISKSDGKSVRPIALTSCLCKLLEKLVKMRLDWWLEHHNLLHSSQTGFRKGRSCADNLSNLTLNIQEGFVKKKGTLAVFLDVKGAFPSVIPDILSEQIAKIGGSPQLIKFVTFLTNSRCIFSNTNYNVYRLIFKGLNQGGVLNPTLYNIYTYDIIDDLPDDISVSQFADDVAIYLQTSNKESKYENNKRKLENSLAVVSKKLQTRGLELCPQKSVFVYFNKNRVFPGNKSIIVNGLNVESSETVKFLGLIFDYKLTFFQQVMNILKKTLPALNIIKYLCGTWWGSSPSTLLTMYKSFVRSKIDYALFIYFPSQKNRALMLERIQYLAIRRALGYRNSTPNNILIAESKLPILVERAKFSCKEFIVKSLSNTSTLTSQTIIKTHPTLANNKSLKKNVFAITIRKTITQCPTIIQAPHFPLFANEYDLALYQIPTNCQLGAKLKESEKPNLEFKERTCTSQAINIFTDGSKNPETSSMGLAAVCPQFKIAISKSISSKASIFTAECLALSTAVDIALQIVEKTQNKIINIYSDSLSSILSLGSPNFTVKSNPYLFEIKKKALILTSQHNVKLTLYWIPAHCGIEGNELADLKAKEATTQQYDRTLKIPYTDLSPLFKKRLTLNTNLLIESEGKTKGIEYFEYFHNRKASPWFSNLELERWQIVSINRMRSNHYSLAASLARKNIITDPSCILCGYESQDLDHIIWQCPLLDPQRKDLIFKLKQLCKLTPPLRMRIILSAPNSQACLLILKFLNECKIKV